MARQQQDAKAAISRTAKELQQELLRSADPRAWMLTHPWATLGAAVVAGFAAASVATPTKEEEALSRLAKLEAALNDRNGHDSDNHSDGHSRDKKPSPLSKLSGILLQVVQPVLASAVAGITANMSNQQNQPDQPATPASPTPNPPSTDPSI